MVEDVKLGPEGAETTLPGLMWIGNPPMWSVTTEKQTEEAVMSDKSRRFAFFDEKREWSVGLGFLNKDNLDIMLALNALKQILRFQNNNEDNTWYYVVISQFSHEPERMDARQLERYKIEMILREV